jgi:hypothetical protein
MCHSMLIGFLAKRWTLAPTWVSFLLLYLYLFPTPGSGENKLPSCGCPYEGITWQPDVVLHTYNPSHMRNGGRRILSSRPAWAELAVRPYLKKKRAGVVTEEVEPLLNMCRALGSMPAPWVCGGGGARKNRWPTARENPSPALLIAVCVSLEGGCPQQEPQVMRFPTPPS